MPADKSPLVLLHGLAMSGDVWREVIPLVSDYHEPLVPTAAGHRGGPSVQQRPATMTDIVDAAERYMDDCGLDRPHLAGNSMGGFVAIELARRGRAATVCAFSPGGLWEPGDGFQKRAFARLQRGVKLGRYTRPVLPFVYKSPQLRRLLLRDVACHADRIPASRALEFIDDGIECEVLAELCAAEWLIEKLDPPPCPITITWGEKERLLPRAARGKIARIPQASVRTLPDVGHVPMVDDPGLVARTILTTTGAFSNENH